MYRQFFALAERKRRWLVDDDIPWDKVNRNLNPAIADVVESFCGVELYLPDYIAKAMPLARQNRGWAWFHANWGYEESKHSLALGDWLLRSGARTEEQMTDLESQISDNEYHLPKDSAVGMLIYATVQEMATFLHYRNLQRVVGDQDPALSTLLGYIAVDERAHHAFYRSVVQYLLVQNRSGTIELLRRILLSFSMPAVYLFADSRKREAKVRDLKLFNEDIFFTEVYQPLLAKLGIDHREFRGGRKSKKSDPDVPVIVPTQ